MFKKIFFIFLFSIFQSAVAINVEDLNTNFFEKFHDEYLMEHIQNAISNNHSAKKTTLKIEQFRQEVKYSLGSELPSLSVSANYLGIKIPELDNFELKKNAFALPFIASYEADFLLKNRDKTRSAKKAYEASLMDEKTAYISLLADVAGVYTNIIQYDELIKIQKENIEIYEEIVDLNRKKIKRGIIDTNQLNNSYKNLEDMKNELEKYEKEQKVLMSELMLLEGIQAENIDNIKRKDFASFDFQDEIPDEISSDVIFSRPDVIAAEKQLEKAKIDIRVARKELLPSFNITGIWAFNTLAPGTFFSWESSLAAIMAGATQDIFQGGKKVANLKLKKAKYLELFENYREVDLEAVKEVNTSLYAIKHDSEVDKNTIEKLKREEKNYSDSRKKFDRGIISRNEYLESKSKLLSQKKERAQSKTARIVNYYTLYKASGAKI